MAVVTATLALVVDTALGMWLGIMVFFSFLGAPRAFAVLDDEDAGAYVTDVFPRYYRAGVVLGTTAAAAQMVTGYLGTYTGPTLIVVATAAIATLLAGYSVQSLLPKMDAAEDARFEQYHRRSVLLNGVAMLAVAVALIGAHLGG